MEFETIRNEIKTYTQENGLKYLRKSQLADFAIKHNYELEDIYNVFDYSNEVTSFTERIDNTKYRRYIIGNYSPNEIEIETGLKYCKYCGCFTATAITATDGTTFCSTDCAKWADYYYCTECGKLEKMAYICDNVKLCKTCLDTFHDRYNLQKCSRCHKYVSINRIYTASGKHFCSNCINSLQLITQYHGHSRDNLWHCYKSNREKPNYFGWENEFEIKSDTPKNVIALGINEILEENGLKNFFVFEGDGSLNHGFEAISQPCTLAWLYENESKLQPVYNFMLDNGCTAEKTTTAGLHIHFSRTALTKDYSLAKIAYLINKLQYDFIKYSGRKLNQLYYTQFDESYNSDDEIRLNDFKQMYRNNNERTSKHEAIVNRQHNSTIEIRLFKGTLDLQRIIANVELLTNMIYYVENHTDTQVENVTFKELCLFKKTKYLKPLYYKIFEPNTKIKVVA